MKDDDVVPDTIAVVVFLDGHIEHFQVSLDLLEDALYALVELTAEAEAFAKIIKSYENSAALRMARSVLEKGRLPL